MSQSGSTVALPAYKGLTLKEVFGRTFESKTETFIFGEGTSGDDITGTYNGVPFPLYGTTKCMTLSGKTVSCRGRAFLYNLVDNTSSEAVSFNATPAFMIANRGSFPGTRCEVMQLHNTGSGYVWLRLPINGKPKSGALTFAPWTAAVQLPAKAKAVFGFSCH